MLLLKRVLLFFFGWILRLLGLTTTSHWFYNSSTGSSAVWPTGHFSSSEQRWRNFDWYHCPGLRLTCRCWEWSQLSNLKSFTIICLSLPHEAIFTPQHLSHFLSLFTLVSVSNHINGSISSTGLTDASHLLLLRGCLFVGLNKNAHMSSLLSILHQKIWKQKVSFIFSWEK